MVITQASKERKKTDNPLEGRHGLGVPGELPRRLGMTAWVGGGERILSV